MILRGERSRRKQKKNGNDKVDKGIYSVMDTVEARTVLRVVAYLYITQTKSYASGMTVI